MVSSEYESYGWFLLMVTVCPPAIPEEGSSLYQTAGLEDQLMRLTAELVASKTDAKKQGCPIKFY